VGESTQEWVDFFCLPHLGPLLKEKKRSNDIVDADYGEVKWVVFFCFGGFAE
jgi:hypothetical protein